jgi:small conductance mechanosensitive channel
MTEPVIDTLPEWVLMAALRVGLALGVIALGHFLARRLRALMQQLVAQPQVSEVVGPTIGRLLCDLVYYGLWAFAVGLGLIVVGVPATFVLTVSSIVLILAAVALRESLANVAATVIFVTFQPFRRGEVIETMGKTGAVQELQLFNTVLLTPDQRMVSLPNSEIQASGVVNMTRTGLTRIEVKLTVGYRADLSVVRRVLQDLLAQDARIVDEPPPVVNVQELADTGVRLVVYAVVKTEDVMPVSSDLQEQIKVRFDAAGIPFAMPQREIHLETVPSLTDDPRA